MCLDFDRKVSLEILTDASAARSIANRQGLGKVRHIDTHFLWVQQRVQRGDFIVSKVWGKENPADLLTKFLDAETIKKHMNLFGLMYLTGRAAEAPQLGGVFIDASSIRGIRSPLLHNPARASKSAPTQDSKHPCLPARAKPSIGCFAQPNHLIPPNATPPKTSKTCLVVPWRGAAGKEGCQRIIG